MTVDPLAYKHPDYTPYAYVYNNPIKLIDLFGMDSTQRADAVAQMQNHLDEKTTYKYDVNSSTDPEGTSPGSSGNCSSTAANCVVAGGEANPTKGGKDTGVLNIEANTTEVAKNEDVQAGNIITFRKDGNDDWYHCGIVIDVSKSSDGKITITFGHNTSDSGMKKDTFTIGDDSKWDKRTHGFFKWDTKPDK